VKLDSLGFRLLLAAGMVLAAFFALAAAILEEAFWDSAEQTMKEKLQIHIYSLLSAADLTPSGKLKMPQVLHEPRFATPGSGLYGFIFQADRRPVWRSASALGIDMVPPPFMTPGASVFLQDDTGRFVLYHDIIWEVERGRDREFVFAVTDDSRELILQVAAFRQALHRWLIAVTLLLMAVLFLVLRWGLQPLRNIVKDLTAIERGEKTKLEGRYPSELQGVAQTLNGLLASERAHLERYRNTLADLAHSLKTPLAILRGSLDKVQWDEEILQTCQAQLTRMNQIIEYQLQRAAAKGPKKLTGKADAVAVAGKIIASLRKVYADKALTIELDGEVACWVYCEEGDLYEIVGNLLDNACKWARSHIRVGLYQQTSNAAYRGRYRVLLQIEDDGPGIPEDQLADILQRGVRADQNTQGHGIGMAVVNELVYLLEGQLEGYRSERLHGMCWRVYLP